MPVGTFVWKIASRCNLDCTYCYVYRAADRSWRRQPAYMPAVVAAEAARRIRAYCDAHALRSININFHGGEPLLAGTARLQTYMHAIRGAFAGGATEVRSSLQSNGLLLDAEKCRWMAENGVGLYVSLDGPAAGNDRHRPARRGRPTSSAVEDRLRTLRRSEFSKIFEGFLAVIDLDVPPEEVFDYLAAFKPPAIDFLMPLTNHDTHDRRDYVDWLVRCFDHWFDSGSGIKVRTFERLMTRLLPARTPTEADPIDALIIESNGDIQLDDTLKTAFAGAPDLGVSVFDAPLETICASAAMDRWRERYRPAAACRACHLIKSCGGGHISHRYSAGRGFDNPSVYCRDIQLVSAHVAGRMAREIARLKARASQARVHA